MRKRTIDPPSRPLVFISHDSRDSQIAAALADFLEGVGRHRVDVFWATDRKTQRGIAFGQEWYTSIVAILNRASVVLCLLTPRSVGRPWILFEAGWAKGNGKNLVLGLAVGHPVSDACTGPFALFQNCGDDPDSLRGLVLQIMAAIPDFKVNEKTLNSELERIQKRIRTAVFKIESNTPHLSGDWIYKVKTPEGRESHSGICTITQDGATVRFEGFRKRFLQRVGDATVNTEVDIHWSSTWAEICADGKIHMEYAIDLPEAKTVAVCTLEIRDNGGELLGNYYLLPPYYDKTLNARHGYTHFSRKRS